MLNAIVFFDEITVWWEKPWEGENLSYRVTFNGKTVVTDKTHVTFSELESQTEYDVKVEILCGNDVFMQDSATVATSAVKKKIDVTKLPYGIKGDGKTMNTEALQKAADGLKKDEYLYFPEGVYLTGSICFHGDSEIYLGEGAEIRGSENFTDYLPKIKTRFEGTEVWAYSPLIRIGNMDSAAGQTTENVIIRGKGSILGGGKNLCEGVIEFEKESQKEYIASLGEELKDYECDITIPGRARPFLIDIANVRGAAVSGITVGYGAAWNLHFVYCKDVAVFGCRFLSEGVWNGDGIDPDSSENAVIFDCAFQTHDDAIAVKSGKNPEGNIINRPTRNLRIFDCRGKNGIALGSEMSGGLENIYIWDCNMCGTYRGIQGKVTRKRGGYIKDVRIRDCAAISFRIDCALPYNDDGVGAGKLPVIENWNVKNLTLGSPKDNSSPVIEIGGFEESKESLDNIYIDNVNIRRVGKTENDVVVRNVGNVKISNVRYGEQ